MKRRLLDLFLGKIAAVDRPCQAPAVATIMKRAQDYDSFVKAKYSEEDRRAGAKEGWAMKDGSYPIKDAEDLESAIRAVGRGKNNSHDAIRRHIIARAKALNMSDKLPSNWSSSGEKAKKAFSFAKSLDEPFLCLADTKGGGTAVPITKRSAEIIKHVGLADPDGDEGAEDFETVLSQQELTCEFWDDWYKASNALQASLVSILKDDSVSDKAKMIEETLTQFADHIEGILPDGVSKSLAAGFAALAGASRANGVHNMDEIKKALGLPASATEADVLKAMKAKDEADKKKIEAAEKLAKMSDKHKAFMDHKDAKMPAGGKEAFQEMSAAERDKHMASNPVGEPDEDDTEKALAKGLAFRTEDGSVIHKKDFGSDAAFNLAKSQADKLAKMAEEKAAGDFKKRAVDLGFAEDFGPTLRKAYQGDAASIAKLEGEIKGLREQVAKGALFAEIGSNQGGAATGKAFDQLMAKAEEERKKDPKLTKEQAFEKVYLDPANKSLAEMHKRETRAS